MGIYSKAHQKGKAIEIFNKYQVSVNIDIKLINASLNVFIRLGDIEGMENIFKIIESKGVEYDFINLC